MAGKKADALSHGRESPRKTATGHRAQLLCACIGKGKGQEEHELKKPAAPRDVTVEGPVMQKASGLTLGKICA